MKKIRFFTIAIFASLISVLLSCNNASQIKFEDETNPKFSTDGYSTLSVKMGKTPEYRTLFPDDWTEEKKDVLLYRLTGKDSVNPDFNGEIAPTTLSKLEASPDNTENIFTYEEIISGRATINLDPIHWDLTLTAYQTTDGTQSLNGVKPKVIDDTKPVMSAKVKDVDLSTGAETVTFNLMTYKPVEPSDVELETVTATGELDIWVKFYLTDVEKQLVSKVVLDVVNTTDQSQLLGGSALEVLKKDFGNGPEYYSVHISKDEVAKVKPGDYQLKMTFYDSNSPAKIMLQHIENIKIDGGNLTQSHIDIPKGSFNQPPFAPTGLKSSTCFAPSADVENDDIPQSIVASKKAVINESKKIYAQQIIDSTSEASYETLLTKAIEADKYNLTLNWNDNSFNESSFIVNLATCDAERTNKNYVQLTYNKTDPKINVLSKTLPDSEYAPDPDTVIAYVAGGLGPSEESLTISLPVGTFCQDITVTAINDMGEGKSWPIANSTDFDDPTTPEVSVTQPIQDPVGMFTVAYNLRYPDKQSVASIKYSPEPQTSKVYFVMAYDFNSKAPLITTNPINYPYVMNGKYIFEGWSYTDLQNTGIKIQNLQNFDANANIDPSNWEQGKLKEGSKIRNTNVEVIGSWTSPVTVKVTFPSYSEYKELKSSVNQNPYNTIEPIRDSTDGAYKVTFTIPKVPRTEAVMTDIVFRIYDPYKDATLVYETAKTQLDGVGENDELGLNLDETSDGWSGGKSLIWNVTDFLTVAGNHGDVYRLNISYNYAKRKEGASGYATSTDYETPVTIDGNFFIKISK